ncbi:hypothetical protein H6F38_14305 [Paenibacillus sp. EKM208P]|nr:hypothetical protein H6F38_14305 [Paenibacillus sp. EKM208P]
MKDKYKLFLKRLAQLSEETGVYIETHDDPNYYPTLTTEPSLYQSEKVHNVVWIYYDRSNEKYVGLVNNPYNGETIEEEDLMFGSGSIKTPETQSPFTDYYCWCDTENGRDCWIEVLSEENILNTEEMEKQIAYGKKAHVINHRGYRSFVVLNTNDEMVWCYPPTGYKSDYYQNEDSQKLLWLIR